MSDTAAIGLFCVVFLSLGLFVKWAIEPTAQSAWECRPLPGYCDIDTDWRPSPVNK